MRDKKQVYLENQLRKYEQKIRMNRTERRALHQWVRAGHSVYESPGTCYLCDCSMPVQDFLDAYRQDAEISKELTGKTGEEKEAWLKSHMGYEEPEEKTEPTVRQLNDHIRKSERELFHLWDYIGQEGLWSEAKEYVDETADTPIPFEIV